MLKFRTKFQAKLYKKWVDFWIPLKYKYQGKHLLSKNTIIIKEDNKWSVFKLFMTQEMLNDIKNFKPFDPAMLESEYIQNETRKQNLDFLLDDIPIINFSNQISENMKNNLEKYLEQEKNKDIEHTKSILNDILNDKSKNELQ
jgi:hypothetical protein